MTKSTQATSLLAILFVLLFTLAAPVAAATASATQTAARPGGRFLRVYWYERDVVQAEMTFTRRLRVNAPEVVLHSRFHTRQEVRENGLLLIPIEENLLQLAGAELYVETWGGHPGTANKRLTINGRTTYYLPEVGTFLRNCTHSYPLIPLELTDLVSGYNAIQFACDSGTSFWGHFIVDNACLRVELKESHPDLEQAGLADFHTEVKAIPSSDKSETVEIRLDCPPQFLNAIARVDYRGLYLCYDENGDGLLRDWHGMTKHRLPYGILGTADRPPFAFRWDTSMIPPDEHCRVRAVVHFKDYPNLIYQTTPSLEFAIPPHNAAKVELYSSGDLPVPFLTRVGNEKRCTIVIDDMSPDRIERAEFHTVIWDGGKGEVENPVTLNGHPLPVAGNGAHHVIYRKIEIDPKILKRGANEVVFLSDTQHHGIEVLLPGPALMIRSQKLQ